MCIYHFQITYIKVYQVLLQTFFLPYMFIMLYILTMSKFDTFRLNFGVSRYKSICFNGYSMNGFDARIVDRIGLNCMVNTIRFLLDSIFNSLSMLFRFNLVGHALFPTKGFNLIQLMFNIIRFLDCVRCFTIQFFSMHFSIIHSFCLFSRWLSNLHQILTLVNLKYL